MGSLSLIFQVNPKYNHRYLYEREAKRDFTSTHRKRQYDLGGTGQSDVSTGQGMPGTTTRSWKSQEINFPVAPRGRMALKTP